MTEQQIPAEYAWIKPGVLTGHKMFSGQALVVGRPYLDGRFWWVKVQAYGDGMPEDIGPAMCDNIKFVASPSSHDALAAIEAETQKSRVACAEYAALARDLHYAKSADDKEIATLRAENARLQAELAAAQGRLKSIAEAVRGPKLATGQPWPTEDEFRRIYEDRIHLAEDMALQSIALVGQVRALAEGVEGDG